MPTGKDTVVMTTICSFLLKLEASGVLERFTQQCKEPMKHQEKLLAEIIKANTETRFGNEHGFSRIDSIQTFQQTVPVANYQDLEPYVEAARNGEPGQLTSEDPIMFAMTSGTTGRPKYIPITPTSRKMKKDLLRVWLCGVAADHRDAFDGHVLAVISPEQEETAPCGLPCGAESGHGYKNASVLVRHLYSAPYETFTIENYDARYYAIARIAAGQKIGMIYTCNPSTVLILAEVLAENGPKIVDDVRNGTVSNDFDISDEIRDILLDNISADGKRADELAACLDRDRTLRPAAIWPELGIIGCWKGGNVSTYLDRFGDYFRDEQPVRDIGYFASELRGSVPLSDDCDGGPLAVATNFYEFLHVDEAGDGNPPQNHMLTVDRLEEGEKYFVYITTHAGLYRYEMNDILQVTGLFEKTPMVRFVQKGGGAVSFTGEKLFEIHVTTAVEAAFEDYAGTYDFVQAVGLMNDDRPQYRFYIEFENPPEKAEAQHRLERIEKNLRDVNSEYAGKRSSRRIAPPVLCVVRNGAFEEYRRKAAENGGHDGQFKTIKLTDKTDLADELDLEWETALD
jgi:hypothetical protein